MKRSVFTALLPVVIGAALASCARSAEQSAPPAAPTESVEQLENDRVAALLRGDVAFIERVYSDDYVVNSANGMTRNKAQVIADIKSGVQSFESMSHRDVRVRVYGDTTIVTGHTILKGQYKGQPSLSPTTFTRVYAKLGGQWRLVANTSSVFTEVE